MSLPYPVNPGSGDSKSPYLPNLPASGYPDQNNPYPGGNPGQAPSYPPMPGGSNPSPYPTPGPGFPPNPSPGGYPSNPNPGGYPSNPNPGGYPSNPSPGGYPYNPSQGGYPPNPSSGGYPTNPSQGGYPPNPSSGGYPTTPNPGGYPSNPSPGGYPPNPSSGGYPSNPNPGGYPSNPNPGGYPSNPSSGGYPPSNPSPASTSGPGIYPTIHNPREGTPSYPPSGPGYPSSGSGYPSSSGAEPSAPPMPYPGSTPTTPSNEAQFMPSAYPGVSSSKPPSNQFKVGGISFPLDPKSNSATVRIANEINKRVGAPGSMKDTAKKIFKPFISSGLDNNQPTNEGLGDKMKHLTSDSKSSDMLHAYKNQNFNDIKSKLLKTKRLFEDPEFPASNSLLIDKCNGQDYVVSYFGRSKCENNSIQWLRPHEICASKGKNPEMFVGATNRFDINQGELGNCWFLAALSNLVEDKRYLAQVVPPDQSFRSSYAGIFHFRFWRFGNWVEVVIDDRLPTRQGKLIYLRSVDSNEFWGALLEKAYAKLYGSYKALEGGLTIEASVDFTGGIPELICLDKLSISKERLFYLMSSADANGAFMGAAMTRQPRYTQEALKKGLQSQHAYTITKVVEIRSSNCSGGIPLIRIRNPHGNSKEWRGDWADGDKHWKAIPSHLRDKLGLNFEDDGEFYMSFSDFCIYFGDLEICHLTPDAAVANIDPQGSPVKKFELFKFSGSWSNDKKTSGGCGNSGQRAFMQNPQFFIDLKDPDPYDDELQCSIVISLLQKNFNRSRENIAIGFKVYKCNAGTTSLNESFLKQNAAVERTDTFMNLREMSKRMFMPEGRYCIVPCPYRQGEEANFLLRVFVQRNWGSSEQSQGRLVKGLADDKKKPMHNFADDLQSRLNIHDHRYGGDQKKKIKNVAGKAFNILEQHFPEGTRGFKKLKQFYNWAKDKDGEFALLKKIVKSF